MVWDGHKWKEVAQNASLPASPTEFNWETTDATFINSIIIGSGYESKMNFAMSPIYPNGWGASDNSFAKLTVDYFEVTVKYRRP